MRRFFFAFTCTLLLMFCAPAWSQNVTCTPPGTPGVRVCTPTPNALVAQPDFEVQVSATPAPGAQIAAIVVYANNEGNCVAQNIQVFTCSDSHFYNGWDRITTNAWDTAGNLYTDQRYVYVVGGVDPPCTPPSSPGLVICSPKPGEVYQTQNIQVSYGLTGQAQLTDIRFYLDSQKVEEISQNVGSTGGVGISVPDQNPHSLVVVANDAAGNEYVARQTLQAGYTYGVYGCGRNGCTIGIEVVSPNNNEAYVPNSFPLSATVHNNTAPITYMVAYLDDTQVASSNSGTLNQQVTNAPDGTHLLTVQAWDANGALYRVQQNVNVNVPH